MMPALARQLDWICAQCALEHGAKHYRNHLATYHEGTCGACGEVHAVTEPRDFDWRGTPK